MQRLLTENAATPEEARRANAELRARMRAQDNYFPELEEHARRLLAAIDHPGGPLSQRRTADIAAHLGFALHYVPDLPHSTRTVTDLANGASTCRRATPASATPAHRSCRRSPATCSATRSRRDYGDFLRQRVEANYLAAALMLPEDGAGTFLQEAKAERRLSVEDLRDAFAVPYETAAHRFTNLATRHLGIPVHFMKVHEGGTLHKAYENDGVVFPSDRWARSRGSPSAGSGPRASCSRSPTGSRRTTSTPTPRRARTGARPACSPRRRARSPCRVGVPFAHVRWFRGRETTERRRPAAPTRCAAGSRPRELAQRWSDKSWPSARPHASLLAALPVGVFPGVDTTEVYRFLDRHAPVD